MAGFELSKFPTGILIENELLDEFDSNPTLVHIWELCKKLFITLWHTKRGYKKDYVNYLPHFLSIEDMEENPLILAREKRSKIHITPEELLSLLSEYESLDDEKIKTIDFGWIGMLSLRNEAKFFSDDILPYLLRAFYSGDWILGKEVVEFEKEVCKAFGVRFAVGVNSGTDALIIALRSISLSRYGKEFFSPDDEIIVPDLTFLATVQAVLFAGATPVFANVDEKTYTISPESIRRLINRKTKGMIVVHLYGMPADMDEVRNVADEHNLFVVEDCAQSFFAKYKGKVVGTIGDVGCFSFFPSKNLGGIGDGGLITTNDERIYEFADMLRKYGWRQRDYSEHIGGNSRLDTIQAAVLRAKLKKIDFLTNRRREIAKIYNETLPDTIQKPYDSPERFHVYHQYTIRCKKAEELRDFLNRNKIETRVYYPYPMHKVPALSRGKIYEKLYTEEIIREILSLPIEPVYPDIKIRYVAGKVCEFIDKYL